MIVAHCTSPGSELSGQNARTGARQRRLSVEHGGSIMVGVAALCWCVMQVERVVFSAGTWSRSRTNTSRAVVKVVMCSRGGSASEVETHKNIDSVLHTKTTFQAHSIFSVSV